MLLNYSFEYLSKRLSTFLSCSSLVRTLPSSFSSMLLNSVWYFSSNWLMLVIIFFNSFSAFCTSFLSKSVANLFTPLIKIKKQATKHQKIFCSLSIIAYSFRHIALRPWLSSGLPKVFYYGVIINEKLFFVNK